MFQSNVSEPVVLFCGQKSVLSRYNLGNLGIHATLSFWLISSGILAHLSGDYVSVSTAVNVVVSGQVLAMSCLPAQTSLSLLQWI